MKPDLSEIFLHYDDNSQMLNLTDKLVTKLSFERHPDRINQVIKTSGTIGYRLESSTFRRGPVRHDSGRNRLKRYESSER